MNWRKFKKHLAEVRAADAAEHEASLAAGLAELDAQPRKLSVRDRHVIAAAARRAAIARAEERSAADRCE